jgi:predicted NUDIX family NTP pyrophosphohydrolase
MGCGRRLGCGFAEEQYVRDGMAAAIRPRHSFPKLDRAEWFDLAEAQAKILKGQAIFLTRLLEKLAGE